MTKLDKMKSLLLIVFYMILGGASFWLVDIAVLHAWGASGPPFLILTLLLPLVTISVYAMLYGLSGRGPDGPSIAVYVLIGILIVGPTSLKLFWSFSLVDWSWIVMFSLNPLYIFMTFGYSGSIGALFIILPLLIAAHLFFERNHWVIPARDNRSLPPLP